MVVLLQGASRDGGGRGDGSAVCLCVEGYLVVADVPCPVVASIQSWSLLEPRVGVTAGVSCGLRACVCPLSCCK